MADATSEPRKGQRGEDRLSRLFARYNDQLVRTLRGRLGAKWQLADELAQDTWVWAAGSLPSCKVADEDAWTWISALAYRAMAAYFRRARSGEVVVDPAGIEWLSAKDIADRYSYAGLGVAA